MEKQTVMRSEHIMPEALQAVQNFLAYFKFLRKKWWLFAVVGVLGAVAGALFNRLIEPRYEARLTFALEESNGSGGLLGGAMSLAAEQFGISTGSSQDIFKGENIIAILTSRQMIERTLLKIDSTAIGKMTLAEAFVKAEYGSDFAQQHSAFRFPCNQTRSQMSTRQDSALFTLYEKILKSHLITGKPERRFNVFEVKFVSNDERLSGQFASMLVEETSKYYTEMRTKRSKNVLLILEERVKNARGNFIGAATRQNTNINSNLNPTQPTLNTNIQIEEVNKRVQGEAFATLYANLEMARLQYLRDLPLLQVIDAPRYPMKKIKKGMFYTGLITGFLALTATFIFLTILFQIRYKSSD